MVLSKRPHFLADPVWELPKSWFCLDEISWYNDKNTWSTAQNRSLVNSPISCGREDAGVTIWKFYRWQILYTNYLNTRNLVAVSSSITTPSRPSSSSSSSQDYCTHLATDGGKRWSEPDIFCLANTLHSSTSPDYQSISTIISDDSSPSSSSLSLSLHQPWLSSLNCHHHHCLHISTRLEICRDRRDRRSCKIFPSCVREPVKNVLAEFVR